MNKYELVEKNRSFSIELVEIYVSALLFLLVIRLNTELTDKILKFPLIFLGMGLMVYCVYRFRINIKIVLFSFLYCIIFMLNGYLNGNINYYSICSSIVIYLPLAIFFLYDRKLHTWYWNCCFIVLLGYLLYKMIVSVDGYLLFYQTSRNYVSVFIIIAFFICAVASDYNERRVPLVFAVAAFLVAVFSIGRGGIITTFCLLSMLAGYRFFSSTIIKKNKWIMLVAILFCIVAVLMIIGNYELLLEKYFPRLGGKDTFGSNTERMQILKTYLSAVIDAPVDKILFGLQPDNLGGPFGKVEWNIHNSYLQFFANLGSVGVLVWGILIIKSIIFLIKRKKYELLIVLFAFFVRCLTDYLLPGYIGGIILLYYAYLPYATSDDSVKIKRYG